MTVTFLFVCLNCITVEQPAFSLTYVRNIISKPKPKIFTCGSRTQVLYMCATLYLLYSLIYSSRLTKRAAIF